MSPSTRDSTRCSVTPRAAEMLATPCVRHAAIACKSDSTAVGPLLAPTRTAGWSASKMCSRTASIVAKRVGVSTPLRAGRAWSVVVVFPGTFRAVCAELS